MKDNFRALGWMNDYHKGLALLRLTVGKSLRVSRHTRKLTITSESPPKMDLIVLGEISEYQVSILTGTGRHKHHPDIRDTNIQTQSILRSKIIKLTFREGESGESRQQCSQDVSWLMTCLLGIHMTSLHPSSRRRSSCGTNCVCKLKQQQRGCLRRRWWWVAREQKP